MLRPAHKCALHGILFLAAVLQHWAQSTDVLRDRLMSFLFPTEFPNKSQTLNTMKYFFDVNVTAISVFTALIISLFAKLRTAPWNSLYRVFLEECVKSFGTTSGAKQQLKHVYIYLNTKHYA